MYGIRRRACTFALGLLPAVSGCGPLGSGGTDVPCLRPTGWPDAEMDSRELLYVRPETMGSDVLLLTHQTARQREEDEQDGVIGNGPHNAVYRFDPGAETFELVGDEAWDGATGFVTDCTRSSVRDTAFATPGHDELIFEGEPLAVAGGGDLLRIAGAPSSPAVAVLSTTGISFSRFFTPGSTGQHYHQLFSEIDGRPLGEPVRLGVGSNSATVRARWTWDEQYVIYHHDEVMGRLAYDLICVVPVKEEMALLDELGDGGSSDVPCLHPSEWPRSLQHLYVRLQTPGSDVLVLTHATFEQHEEDSLDQVVGNGPHAPAYRFDPITESFELVDDDIWDQADGELVDCYSDGVRRSAFTYTEDNRLLFDGEALEVVGGTVVLPSGAPGTPVTAVLSTDGFPFFRPYGTGFTGQYSHQLFSEIDGQALGEPVQVGVSWRGAWQSVCWTADNRYVLYYQSEGLPQDVLVCVVRVDTEQPAPESEPEQ